MAFCDRLILLELLGVEMQRSFCSVSVFFKVDLDRYLIILKAFAFEIEERNERSNPSGQKLPASHTDRPKQLQPFGECLLPETFSLPSYFLQMKKTTVLGHLTGIGPKPGGQYAH